MIIIVFNHKYKEQLTLEALLILYVILIVLFIFNILYTKYVKYIKNNQTNKDVSFLRYLTYRNMSLREFFNKTSRGKVNRQIKTKHTLKKIKSYY